MVKDFARLCGTGISSYEKDSIKLPQKLEQRRINGYRQKQDIGRIGSTEMGNGKWEMGKWEMGNQHKECAVKFYGYPAKM